MLVTPCKQAHFPPGGARVGFDATRAFASKVIESLAWPLAAVALVALLRAEIHSLVPLLKRIKAGPVEAEFERDVRELKTSTPQPAQVAGSPKPDVASKEFLLQLAQVHPRSAILEGWVRVEAVARAALARMAPAAGVSTYIPAAKLAEPLARKELLAEDQVTLFHELRRLRNDVAHSQTLEPSADAVNTYIELSAYLQGWLEAARNDA